MSVVSVVHRSRLSAIFWFGRISYRMLKLTYEVLKMVCPMCLHELEDITYDGDRVFATDKSACDYVRDSWMSLVEDGRVVWHVVPDRHRRPMHAEWVDKSFD